MLAHLLTKSSVHRLLFTHYVTKTVKAPVPYLDATVHHDVCFDSGEWSQCPGRWDELRYLGVNERVVYLFVTDALSLVLLRIIIRGGI